MRRGKQEANSDDNSGDFNSDNSSWIFTASTVDESGGWESTGRTGGSVYADQA